MAYVCQECKLEVANRDALVAHWAEQREKGNKHFHCPDCVILFRDPNTHVRHRQERHPVKQDLACPGCHARFTSAGGLVDHIERNLCKKISNHQFVERREQKLAFERELQRREKEALPESLSLASLTLSEIENGLNGVYQRPRYDFTRHLSRAAAGVASHINPMTTRPESEGVKTGQGLLDEYPELEQDRSAAKQSQAASLGDISQPGVEKQRQTGHQLAQGKRLFQNSPAAVARVPKKVEVGQRAGQNTGSPWPEHDPRNPKWNPNDYYVKHTDKYKCPHERCPKSFRNGAGLRGHLLSEVHTGLLKVQCPRCAKWFNSMAALTQHVESPSVRCNIRNTDGYDDFLDKLTAGIVDRAGSNPDGMPKLTVSEGARTAFVERSEEKQEDKGWDDECGPSW